MRDFYAEEGPRIFARPRSLPRRLRYPKYDRRVLDEVPADSHADGGIWANNPALVGITEAVRYAGRGLSDIRLLSLGTNTRTL